MKRSPEMISSLRALASGGATATEIARALRVSLPTTIRWAADELILLLPMSEARKKTWADPEARARMSEAIKKALADPEARARIKAARSGCKGISIPNWVPIDLHDEFLEICASDGEESAASHVRRLKRELARCLAS